MDTDRFATVVFFIGLIMAAILWLPEQLGIDSVWCVSAAFIIAVIIVFSRGIHNM